MKIRSALFAAFFAFFVSNAAQAALVIDITEGVDAASPIAVVPFAEGGGDMPLDIASVVANDLRLTGLFAPRPRADMLATPSNSADVNYLNWRILEVDHLVIGRIDPTGTGRYTVQFELLNVHRQERLLAFSIPSDRANLRTTAHHVADLIYEKLTGQKGIFNTQIAYVTLRRNATPPTYALKVSDMDGYNATSVFTSTDPILSPAWSPDAKWLAYVSFEGRRSQIFMQNLQTGQRELISSRKGINGAPAFSPDGRKIAMALSSGGNVDIHVYDIASQRLTRITDHPAIDTEPDWSPNSREIAFTSDRGGRPQIYVTAAHGSFAKRVSFEGKENARPRYSSDGKRIAMVHGDRGKYRIGVLRLDTSDFQVLTDGRLDESPSFAPNGAVLIYGSNNGPRGQLAMVSADGRVRQRLTLTEGDVREPAWSPFTQ